MPLILLLNAYVDPTSGHLTGTHWPLPSETDEQDLRRRLNDGMGTGQTIEVSVLLPETDRQEASLLLNGSLLTSVLIVNAPEQFDDSGSTRGSTGQSKAG
ncbi:hypothetical protein [Micromonospora sp. NPDC005806]|uniref:hypothetical protein n=1 Tax=Micromonospora sp. NPDC005806 TaxID=3364234 RepID=UPI0036AB3015